MVRLQVKHLPTTACPTVNPLICPRCSRPEDRENTMLQQVKISRLPLVSDQEVG